jgi:carbamate kinase
MRIVIALGGNALLRRGEPMTAFVQRQNIHRAAVALAPLARDHEIVLTHGNGPQVGLLALQAAYAGTEAYPLDVLGAETEGMIGYMVEQELANLLPPHTPIATILTMVEVDPEDPAFEHPTKFVGPVYTKEQVDAIKEDRNWTFARDGGRWRRVVPSPDPKRIFEIRPVTWLLEKGAIVICTGGGGIPTAFSPERKRTLLGVEAVVDKDLASALLAEEVEAHLLVMATDVDGVYLDWDTDHAERIGGVTPEELATHRFAEGSMGPKVEAACRFVSRTGGRAAIGSLMDLEELVAGTAGTQVGGGGLGHA